MLIKSEVSTAVSHGALYPGGSVTITFIAPLGLNSLWFKVQYQEFELRCKKASSLGDTMYCVACDLGI